jgi:drug/metabolite transporter (DMT)-like permease
MARAYLAISLVTLLWAANFTAAKIGTAQLDPFFIAGVRILATAAVYFLMLPPEQRRIERKDLGLILPLSLTGIATNHLCFAAGIQITTPSHSAIIHALIPVFVAVAAWFLIRERLSGLGIAGMLLAVAGALVVVLGASREEMRKSIWGDVLTTIGITAFTFYTVFGRRAIERMGSLRVVTLGFLFAVPVMVPFLAWGAIRTDWSRVTWQGWAALAYMFVGANLIAYRCHIYALSHLTAGRVAAFTTLQPAIGISIAVAADQDTLSSTLVAGSVLALGGVVLVQLRQGPPPVQS